MPDRSDIDRILATNRYIVLGTADEAGQPWVTPVFFAPLDADRVCWVSSPDSRHSRNIAHRAAIAITAFDSTVEVGQAEAAYFDAEAAAASPVETEAALQALNARLPVGKQLGVETCSRTDRWSSTEPNSGSGTSSSAVATRTTETSST